MSKKLIKILVFLFLLIGLYLYILYKRYNLKKDFTEIIEKEKIEEDSNIPYVVKGKLNNLKDWNIDFFRKNYGNKKILVLKSDNKGCTVSDSELIEMELREYIDNYIRGNNPNKKKYYFRSEDYYKFLKDVGLDKRIEMELKKELPWYIHLTYSFWMGPKGSTTTFHYDTDNTNYLCVLEGRKKVLLVRPSGEDNIIPLKTPYGNYYTIFDPENEERLSKMKKEKTICEIIVNKGEILNIPRNIWHAVINLEDTVAFTLHYDTLESIVQYLLLNKL